MKTASLTYPKHRFIDTARLFSRYDVLARAVLVFVMAGRLNQALRSTYKVVRLVRTLSKLEAHNVQLRRKLDMLGNKPWRERVLRDLGGMRKLKLWEAAKERIATRAVAPCKELQRKGPAWLYTPERIAESERLKARARMCRRAGQNPLIVRDRCKVDFEGDFRLAPLPRGERAARQMRVYTENTIVEYDWNPIPFQKEKGFGPACVWPVEFYAAMEIEAEILAGRAGDHSPLSSPQERGSNRKELRLLLDPLSSVCKQTQGGDDKEERRDDKEKGRGERKRKKATVPTISIYYALPPKVLHDLFAPLPQETPHACS